MIVVSLFRVALGFMFACIVAAVVQIGFALTPAALLTDRADELAALAILLLRTATQLARFALSFALVVAIVGEWQSIRSSIFYGLSGIAISAAGFLAQSANESAGQPTILNTYALTAYLSSGLAGGLAYWMLAGRYAGGRPDRRRFRDSPIADQSTL